jgi:hypothetical protein
MTPGKAKLFTMSGSVIRTVAGRDSQFRSWHCLLLGQPGTQNYIHVCISEIPVDNSTERLFISYHLQVLCNAIVKL